ncbi:MAG: DUF2092 domain-containing protein [Acidobacteria bacterium]|nr:DUF2092 domain-containing protein [Acidobacteriota bacterium]
MRRFGRRIFISTSACALAPGQAQQRDEEAKGLLKKVQETYVATTAYDLDFQENARFDSYTGYWPNTISGRMACLEPHRFLYQTPLRDPNSGKAPERILCGDGASVFVFVASRNREYIREIYSDQGATARRTTGGDEYFKLHMEHVERFRTVASREQKEPRSLGRQMVKVFGQTVECEVVETYPADGRGFTVQETLWVEPGSNRVLRCLRQGYQADRRNSRRTSKIVDRTYRWRMLGTQIAMDVFQFVPPKGARLVDRFSPGRPLAVSVPSGHA